MNDEYLDATLGDGAAENGPRKGGKTKHLKDRVDDREKRHKISFAKFGIIPISDRQHPRANLANAEF